jgi:hypothetical protein
MEDSWKSRDDCTRSNTANSDHMCLSREKDLCLGRVDRVGRAVPKAEAAIPFNRRGGRFHQACMRTGCSVGWIGSAATNVVTDSAVYEDGQPCSPPTGGRSFHGRVASIDQHLQVAQTEVLKSFIRFRRRDHL